MIEKIDYNKCNSCGTCFDTCPMDCFRTIGNKVYIAYQKDCMCCYLCELYCPAQALFVSPERGRPVSLPF